jgi:putative ABC transport system permease protein
VLILGVGIGANTAVSSLIKGVLLQPLPYPQADRLVEIFQPLRNLQTFQMAYPDYEDFCANQQSFQDLALILLGDKLSLTGQGDPARIGAAFVTGNFFKTLGRSLILGRPFSETEDKPGAPAVAILGERLWRTRFHADPQIVGTHLILSGTSFQVIGVTPQQAEETGQIGVGCAGA